MRKIQPEAVKKEWNLTLNWIINWPEAKELATF